MLEEMTFMERLKGINIYSSAKEKAMTVCTYLKVINIKEVKELFWKI